MKLLILERNTWDIVAEIDGDRCPLVEWLSQLGEQYQSSVDGLLKIFERAAQYGPRELGDKLCHEIDEDEKLFEFIKGDIRIIWFYGKNKIVCCSHGIIKKHQKIPQREKDKAIRLKERYATAIERATVRLVEE